MVKQHKLLVRWETDKPGSSRIRVIQWGCCRQGRRCGRDCRRWRGSIFLTE